MKEQILKLRAEGLSYNQIQKIVGCSKGNISFHCGEGQKEKTNKRNRLNRSFKNESDIEFYLKNRILLRIVNTKCKKSIRNCFKKDNVIDYNYNVDDFVKSVINNPVCYITGKKIDLLDKQSYHFDHYIPVSKGGKNDSSNLRLCLKEANQAKNDMLFEDFLELCKTVLVNNGYKVTI